MQPADYRLVRSHIKAGIMVAIKRDVYPKSIDNYFSYWLYGQKKSAEEISVNLTRSIPCSICSTNNEQCQNFSLLTVDVNLFLRCCSLLDNEQLSSLYSLLDDDRQFYLYNIRQQYNQYKQHLKTTLNEKLRQKYYPV